MIIDRKRLFIIVLTLLTGSCSEDISLITNGESEPVVYGIINPSDSLNYIRITKTFSGDKPAYELAQQASNLFYDSVSVTLDVNSAEGYPLESFILTKAILNHRDPGIFASDPNIFYVFNGCLNNYIRDGYQIQLSVNIHDNNRLLSASQTFHHAPVILNPKKGQNTYISFYFVDPFRIEWEDLYGYKSYEVSLRFNYIDHFEDSSKLEFVDIRSTYHGQTQADDQFRTLTQYMGGNEFFQKLGTRIPRSKEVILRSFTGIEIIVTAIGSDFLDYLETNEIASDNMGRPVTNIVGGIGIFALKGVTRNTGYLLDPISLDSLVKGSYTRDLKFVKW